MGFVHLNRALARKRKMKVETEANKSKEGNARSRGSQDGENIITDSRFSSLHSDPRFQKIPKRDSKVILDSRFHRLFVDKNFGSSSAFDKRGKRKKYDSGNLLHHYYRAAHAGEDEELASEEEKRKFNIANHSVKYFTTNKTRGSPTVCSSSEEVKSEWSNEESSSGTETDSDSEGEYEVGVEGGHLLQEEDIPTTENETHRLAMVNMDWNYVKAVDIYVLLSSFLPRSGYIVSVAVYPSEFGLQRMEAESLHGPIGLFDEDKHKDDETSDKDEFDNEKLRSYEISRLRYYYAVVDCNSSSTANYLYRACDGVELERTSTVLDLRFIPDSMEFKYPPRDIAKELPLRYERLDFHTRALQQSKVDLSWDQDEPQRSKTLKRKFNSEQLAELELKEYLASDESDSEEDDMNGEAERDALERKNKRHELYRSLVQHNDSSDAEEKDDCQEMEVTFNTGLEGLSKRILEKKDKGSETVWEAYLRKRREKRKANKSNTKCSSSDEGSDGNDEPIEPSGDFFVDEQGDRTEASKAELELLLADDDGTGTAPKGYNIKQPKKKEKVAAVQDKIPSGSFDDPRFSAIFTSPLFSLDPTDAQFKRSAVYARKLAQKPHEGTSVDGMEDEAHLDSSTELSRKERLELSSSLRSVKVKSKQAQVPSKRVSGDNLRRVAQLVYPNGAM